MPSHKLKHILQQARSGASTLLLACCLVSCGNNIEKIKMFEPQELPDNIIKDAKIQRSEYGKLQLLMQAPLIEQYSKPEPKTEYREGIKMQFFDGYNHPTGILTARYAVNFERRNIMMVRDSVVIIDLRSGDTVYLKNLTWNQAEHRIYSDTSLWSKNGQRLTYGDRFESDDSLHSPVIIHQRGTLEWKED